MAAKAVKPKKTPQKQKTSRPKAKEKTHKQILTKELTALFKQMDEKGLEFLKHQAEVLLHNARIEEVRKKAALEAAALQDRDSKPQHATAGNHAAMGTALTGTGEVRIERLDTNFFNIYVGKSRVFFNRDELRSLAKICHASGSISEATTRLYRWFERERKDFLNDTGIERSGAPALSALYNIIVKTYQVKEG